MPQTRSLHQSEAYKAAKEAVSLEHYAPEYWVNDYNDCVQLGEELILNYLRMNARLRKHVSNFRSLLKNKEDGIYINLMEFNPMYRQKFILPDLGAYCLKFMESLTPVLEDFIKIIGHGAHGFKFTFRMEELVFEECLTVFRVTEPKESSN